MIDYPVITLLEKLSREEFLKFKKYINSPYFINSSSLNELIKILYNYYHLYLNKPSKKKKKELTENYIRSKSKKLINKDLTRLFRNLYQYFLDFLSQTNYQSKINEKKVDLLYELENRVKIAEFHKEYLSIYESLEDVRNISKDFDVSQISIRLDLLESKYNFEGIKDDLYKTERIVEIFEIQYSMIRTFSLFIVINYLREYIVFIRWLENNYKHDKIQKDEFYIIFKDFINNEKFHNLFLEFFRKPEESEKHLVPVVKLYYFLYLIFKKDEVDKNILEFRNLFKDVYISLSVNERFFLFSAFRNILSSRENERYFIDYEFDFYSEYLDKDFYVLDGKDFLTEHEFNFYLIRGSECNKTEWVMNFYEKNKDRVKNKADKIKLKLVYEILSNINMELYSDAIPLLQAFKEMKDLTVNSKDFIRTYLIICYYEIENFDNVENLLKAFRASIKYRDFISDEKQKIALKYLKITEDLINDKISEFEADKLIVELQYYPISGYGNWLIKKLSKLIQK